MAEIFSSWEYISDTELAPRFPPVSVNFWEAVLEPPNKIYLTPLLPTLPVVITDFWEDKYQDELTPRKIPKSINSATHFTPQPSYRGVGQIIKLNTSTGIQPSFSHATPQKVNIQSTVTPLPLVLLRTLRKLDFTSIVSPIPFLRIKKTPILNLSITSAPSPSFSAVKPSAISVSLNLTPVIPFSIELTVPLTRKDWGWRKVLTIKRTGWREGF